MKNWGIYNGYAEEYWTDNEGKPLSFTAKSDAQEHVRNERITMRLDSHESQVKILKTAGSNE